MTVTLHFPQIVMLVLLILSMAYNMSHNDGGPSFLGDLVMIFLLWWGGFWTGGNCG